MLIHYIENSFIIDIKSTTFRGALEELLECCPLGRNQKRSLLVKKLMEQENTVSSFLGQGIALPHLKVPLRKSYLFALGRVRTPLKDPSVHSSEKIRLIVLLLASSKIDNYLATLSSFAKIMQTIHLPEDASSLSLEDFKEQVVKGCRLLPAKRTRKNRTFNKLMFREAMKIARAGNCTSVFLFQDTFESSSSDIFDLNGDLKTIVVTHQASAVSQAGTTFTLPVQLFSFERLSQLRSAVLLALIHKYIDYNEKICCIGGLPKSNRIDTVLIVDANTEIQSVFSQQTDILPKNVQPEVFERLLTIATELAIEGREGRAIGCLFVLGDMKALEPYIHPLILNPFHGYNTEDRNLLNPFIDETIKEYSLLDGAIIINSNGVVESAGSLIHANNQVALPGGFGTRHAAAVAISKAVDCVAVAISSSSGQVTLFRNGKMLPLFDKGIGGGNTAV